MLWVFNGFNGDELDLAAMSPYLDLYLSNGGNLLLVGKDLHDYLPPELEQRATINSWLTPVEWTATDTARAEHPALADFGKITGSTMSLCPEFALAETALSFPLFRKSLSTAGYIGVAARETVNSRLNFVLLSVRPYRAAPAALAATMDTLLSDFLGRTLAEPVNALTALRVGQNLRLLWQSVPGATGYWVSRISNLALPLNRATVVATVFTPAWIDPQDVSALPAQLHYVVFPIFP